MSIPVNYLAVLVAALVQMVVGFLWYGPLFGKSWMMLMGFSKESMEAGKKGMGKKYVAMFVSALVMSYVSATYVFYVNAASFGQGIFMGVWLWLGYIATVGLGSILWESKPAKLYYINSGYYLVALSLMGGVLAAWR